jgi:flavin reductase (DIM6/NTAB) family NADH-FMN oxidoreductase RutF
VARRPIALEEFAVKPYHLWDRQWLLLTAGDFAARRFNAMTVGWGSLGVMWNLPFVQVVVRPTRYTHGFMEEHSTFTLCAFPEACRSALELLGTRSGRDGDKITASGLTPVASTLVAAPSYAEAELVLECRKIYWADLDPGHFLDPRIQPLYPAQDYHRAYFGEILAVLGEEGVR